jgi:hypothetical protein
MWMGEPHQIWIKTIFATFYAAGVALLGIVSGRLTGSHRLGLVLAVLFFLVPTEVGGLGSAASGYADFPLSIFYFAAIAYFLLWLRERADYNFRVFAFCLAFLPWFKREGMILWVAGAVLALLVLFSGRKFRLWRLFALFPGLMMAGAWNLYLRAVHLQMDSEFSGLSFSVLLKNAGRFRSTCDALFDEMMKFNAWGIFWFLGALALLYLSAQVRRISRSALLFAVIIPLGAYCSLYVFSTAGNYLVHINLSLPRLLMHVVPVLWLAIGVAVAMPWKLENSSEPALADLQES